MIGEPVTDAQLNQVLALGDIDHDGRIDYEGALHPSLHTAACGSVEMIISCISRQE